MLAERSTFCCGLFHSPSYDVRETEACETFSLCIDKDGPILVNIKLALLEQVAEDGSHVIHQRKDSLLGTLAPDEHLARRGQSKIDSIDAFREKLQAFRSRGQCKRALVQRRVR